ncbi:insulinase family protein [Ligilactobacillus equi]|uniref:EF-P 5-aminopentanol modification-associated protein YfmF n=1 Tax=Ligilactobacillus equi TaxID=137357 RepID=UPI002ED5D4A6
MKVALKQGVYLDITASKQFKTSRIMISFSRQAQSAKELAMRTLITSVLETASAKYPTQKQLADHLSYLYGANFGIYINRYGRLNQVIASLTLANDRFLKDDTNLLAAGLDFLNEVLVNPLLDEAGLFDEKIFTLQQKNLASYIKSIQDNKRSYVAMQIQSAYYTDVVQATPQMGTPEDVLALDRAEVTAYYHQMLAQDEVLITINGEVDPMQVEADCQTSLNLVARPAQKWQLYYQQALLPAVIRKVEKQVLNQSKLDFVFALNYQHPAENYAAILFNTLFGASPLSKLFVNIREKQSMAYYASSSLNAFTNSLLIQTGIEGRNAKKVEMLVLEQLTSIIAGDFSAQELQMAKEEIITAWESQLDSQGNDLNQKNLNHFLNHQSDYATKVAKLQAVTKAQVQAVAQKARLQAVYLLDGQEG